jgi:hypothetical protein
MRKHDSALALVLSATDDLAPSISALDQEIRRRWDLTAKPDQANPCPLTRSCR